MMKSKRILALLSALALSLCGCTVEGDSSDYSSSVSEEATEDTPANLNTTEVTKASPASLSKTVHCWGQGKQFDDLNRPVSCTQFQQEFGNYDASFIKEDCGNTIYLTFDEGYENGYTSQILDVLKEKNVPAVFFVTGDYLERSPELVQRMIDEGHTVGNHTENHPSMPTLSESKMAEEINTLSQAVKERFGYQMTLFRPPKGEFSEESLAVTQEQGYESVFWSFAYADWDPDNQPNPTTALNTLTERLHPGAIYLLHAVSSTNAQILGDWIDQTRATGYEFALLN